MTDAPLPAQRFAPSQIELELPFGTFLFRLGAVQIATLQEVRGVRVKYPDGGEGRRPKPLGTIVREHLAGIGGHLPNLDGDPYFADFDAADSREVIVQGLIGGARGQLPTGPVVVDEMLARRLVVEHVDPWPANTKWETATAILVACTQGYQPPKPPGEEPDPGNAEAAATSSSTSPPPPGT